MNSGIEWCVVLGVLGLVLFFVVIGLVMFFRFSGWFISCVSLLLVMLLVVFRFLW